MATIINGAGGLIGHASYSRAHDRHDRFDASQASDPRRLEMDLSINEFRKGLLGRYGLIQPKKPKPNPVLLLL